MEIEQLASQAKKASIDLAAADTNTKNKALKSISDGLLKKSKDIINANKLDLEESKKNNLAAPLLKRLKFDEKKIKDAIEGIESLIKIDDPAGTTLSCTELDDGLELYKVSCPIGVIGVIFESRPDALIQISTLCLKSGNSVLLKGGSEAKNTNRILADIIAEESLKAGIPEGWIQLLETRSDVNEMLKLDEYIDLIIPRGSNEFVKYIMDNSNITVLGHADGICHVYIDKDADVDMAAEIAYDSKTQYTAVCNAAECILVHEDIADKALALIKNKLDQQNVEIYGCEKTCNIIDVKSATEENWKTEYLDYKVSMKIVGSDKEAIDHINKYGSGHTDSIVTADESTARSFISLVDSGSVFWNCSTRFSDGYRYALGAEVGISTNKIHARGPVGLEGLLIYKWIIKGKGQIVEDYSSGQKSFTHKPLDKKY